MGINPSSLPNSTTRIFAEELTSLRRDVDTLQRALRSAQLGQSTIDDGAIGITKNGVTRGQIGITADGSFAVISSNAPPPPTPSTPTVTPIASGMMVKWDGNFGGQPRPNDFSFVEIYYNSTNNFSSATLSGTMTDPGEWPVAPLSSGTTYYFWLVAVNTSRKSSGPTAAVSGTPNQVVAQALLDGIVTELKLANNAVTEAKVATSAITTTKVADNAVTTPKVIAGAIQANQIATGAVLADKIATNAVTADKILALAITADKIAANAINAGHISAGSVTAAKLASTLLLSTTIIAGTSTTGARVVLNSGGIEAYRSNGTKTLDFDNATGNLTIAGIYRSADGNTRIEINPGGGAPDEARFYQNGVYGYMMAESAPGSTAAISINGSGSNRGKVVAYPGEAATSWANSSNVSQSAFSSTSGTAAVWGGVVNLEGRDQYGNGEVTISYRNSSGGLDNRRALFFRGAGSGEAALYSANYNVQLVWTTAGIVVQDVAGIGKQIIASNTSPSSRRVKKGEKPINLGNRKLRQIINSLVPKQWNYDNEWVEGEPKPVQKYTVRGELKRNEQGQVLFDPVTQEELREPDQEVEVEIGPPVKPHFGLMAEDVQQVLPEIVQDIPTASGGLGLADRDLIAILWMYGREMNQEVKKLEDRITALESV
jgi:hypothetical protein